MNMLVVARIGGWADGNYYDSRSDSEANWKISVEDVEPESAAFGAFEGSAKNPKNRKWGPGYQVSRPQLLNLSWTSNVGWGITDYFYVGGYSRIVPLIQITGWSSNDMEVNITSHILEWNMKNDASEEGFFENFPDGIILWRNFVSVFPYHRIPAIETKAPYVRFSINPYSSHVTGWVQFKLWLYMRND